MYFMIKMLDSCFDGVPQLTSVPVPTPVDSATPIGDILIPCLGCSVNRSFLPHLQCPSLVEVIDLPLVHVRDLRADEVLHTHDLEQLPSYPFFSL